LAHGLGDLSTVGDRFALKDDDDIVALDTRLVGGTGPEHICYPDALVG
jgi:hypothetical protein